MIKNYRTERLEVMANIKSLPQYSGVFNTDKKTCVICLNSDYANMLIVEFEPTKLILGEVTIISSFIGEPSITVTDPELIDNLEKTLKEECKTYNIIFFSNDKEILSMLIKNDIYGLRYESVSLMTALDEFTKLSIEEQVSFINNLKKSSPWGLAGTFFIKKSTHNYL